MTIGYIESRKGQDILVESVKALDESVRNESEFLLVGSLVSFYPRRHKKTPNHGASKSPESLLTDLIKRRNN